MENVPAETLPIQRVHAEGRVLAAFLNEQSAQSLPDFVRAAETVQNEIRSRFDKLDVCKPIDLFPVFGHVLDREVAEMVGLVAAQVAGPPALNNLVGFEWLDINGVISGHYVAAPMPATGEVPTTDSQEIEVARYCLFGPAVAAAIPLPNGDIVTSERLRLQLQRINLQGTRLVIDYAVGQEPSPVAILLLRGRAIAIQHQERLVALLETGITKALCMINYGYGTDSLRRMPSITEEQLMAARPPLISDFVDEHLMVRIPVRTPRQLLRFSYQAVDLAVPN